MLTDGILEHHERKQTKQRAETWVRTMDYPFRVFKIMFEGTSLAVQWLRLHISTARGAGSIPGQGTKIPHASAAWPKN